MMTRPNPEFNRQYCEKFNRVPGIDLNRIDRLLVARESPSETTRAYATRLLQRSKATIVRAQLLTPKPFLMVPDKHQNVGEIPFARFFQGSRELEECMITATDIPMTVDISNIGTGKTRALFHIIRSVNKTSRAAGGKLSFFVIDRRDDFRSLGIDEVVLRLGSPGCGINIFENPPGVDQVTWTAHVAESFVNAIQAWLASRNQFILAVEATKHMTTMVKAAAELLHPKSSDSEKIPTFAEVYQTILEDYLYDRTKSGRQTEIEEVLIDRMFSMLRQAKQSFRARRSVPIEQMLDDGISIVLEADVSPDLYSLLFSWAGLRMFLYHKAKGIRGTITLQSGTIFVVDEGLWVWQPEKERSEQKQVMGSSFQDRMALYIRDFNLAIMTSAQRPMAGDLMAGARIRMAGSLAHHHDAREMALNMGDESLVKVFQSLGVGERVIKIGDRPPALIRFPNVDIQRLTDEEVETRMKPMWDHLNEWCYPKEEVKDEEKKPQVRLNDRQVQLLRSINLHPEWSHARRLDKQFGSTNKSAVKVVEELEAVEYIRAVKFKVGSKVKKFHVPLQPAVDWMRDNGLNVSHINVEGHQGPAHRLICILIIAALRARGYNVFHDHWVGKKRVDVFCDGIAYEVCASKAVDVENVMDALANGAAKFVFVCYDENMQAGMSDLLPKDPRIELRLASEMVENLQTPTLVSIMENQDKQDNQSDNEDSNGRGRDQATSQTGGAAE